jgi:protein TonB
VPKRQELLRRLSDAGITPRCLLRLDAELQDHYVDLQREALAAEKSAVEASAEARLRLGDDDAIATEFLAHTELKLWIYRWPIVLYCLGLIVWSLLVLLSPLQGLLRNRAAVARYSLALCSSVALLCALLLSMQLIVSIDPPATNTAAYSVERREIAIADLSSSLTARERRKFSRSRFLLRRPAEPAPVGPNLASLTRVDDALVSSPMNIGDFQIRLADGDYLPIVKIAPIYPSGALAQGLEGYVVVQFTVARSGAVKDVVIIESTDSLFEHAAIEAAYKFKYRPRVVRGESIEVPGVRNKISFDIAV